MEHIFEQANPQLLIRAILALETAEECQAFLEDIMTTREVLDISQRMAVAWQLDDKVSTAKIAEATGASPATISRVNRCYQYGAGGYTAVLKKLKEEET
ncbi:MAG: YerC/YecD family TrpR-related protein [Oscillospiraceae bacterium]|nr:YerC/YecD family TrpR-related protein [Oscillospiraceae bacterium]MDD6503553.1 YerC/YecD family TrpR-related protein [Oscillospiraceae bacterium]